MVMTMIRTCHSDKVISASEKIFSLARYTRVCMFICGMLASSSGHAQSLKDPKPLGMRVAISTFVYMGDIDTHEFLEDRRAYLPAGTRFIVFDEKMRFRGVDWRLILTETGLWAYIKSTENPDQYFNPANRQLFLDNERIAIIQRSDEISINLSPDARIVVLLTRSESYPLLSEVEEGFTIALDKIKIGEDVRVEAVIPYDKNMITVFDTKSLLDRNDIHEFQRNIADGVFGIQKPCGVSRIDRLGGGGGLSFSFDAWFAKADISGSAEITREEVLKPEFGIRRTYFPRRGDSGSYHITEKQECATAEQALSYRAVNPEGKEFEVSKQVALDQEFGIDDNTRRLLVTTPEDYFKLFDLLKGRRFTDEEIPFLISELVEVAPE